MTKLLFTIALSFAITLASGQNQQFKKLLEEGGLEFTMPDGFDTIATRQNPDMNYELVLQSKNDSFEIRYAIRPLKKRVEEFEKMAADSTKTNISSAKSHPNKMYKMTLMAVLINTSLQQQGSNTPTIPRLSEFKPEAVKNEFNADWGAMSGYPPRASFDSTYKNCMTVALHRDNASDVYIFYLFNNRETFMRMTTPPVFHAIRYK
ncbi:hypothetical protein [Niabella aquatica]